MWRFSSEAVNELVLIVIACAVWGKNVGKDNSVYDNALVLCI